MNVDLSSSSPTTTSLFAFLTNVRSICNLGARTDPKSLYELLRNPKASIPTTFGLDTADGYSWHRMNAR